MRTRVSAPAVGLPADGLADTKVPAATGVHAPERRSKISTSDAPVRIHTSSSAGESGAVCDTVTTSPMRSPSMRLPSASSASRRTVASAATAACAAAATACVSAVVARPDTSGITPAASRSAVIAPSAIVTGSPATVPSPDTGAAVTTWVSAAPARSAVTIWLNQASPPEIDIDSTVTSAPSERATTRSMVTVVGPASIASVIVICCPSASVHGPTCTTDCDANSVSDSVNVSVRPMRWDTCRSDANDTSPMVWTMRSVRSCWPPAATCSSTAPE